METTLKEVYEQFLGKIIDYEFLSITEEDYVNIMGVKMRSALARMNYKKRDERFIKIEGDKFNRELEENEIECLAYWLVYEWIQPKVNNLEMFTLDFNTKEFQAYSKANHLETMQMLRNNTMYEAYYLKQHLDDYMPPES